MRLEKSLEDDCVAIVERIGGQALKLALIGLRGWPDRTILLPGAHAFFCEFKREGGGKISAQQRKWGVVLRALGFRVYFIDKPKDFDDALAAEIRLARISAGLD